MKTLTFLKTSVALTFALFFAQAPQAQGLADEAGYLSTPTVVGIELEDLVAQAPELLPHAQTLIQSIRQRGNAYGLRPDERVMRRALTEEPRSTSDGWKFSIELFTRSRSQGKVFKRYDVMIPHYSTAVSSVQFLGAIPLRQVHATVQVGLIQRKAIVQDDAHGIKMIFPLGVGAIDPGVSPASRGNTTLMTPTFRGAHIDRQKSVERCSQPRYYRSLPYMPIVRPDGRKTPIAFHIIQHPEMVRGFDSHGCMRLREADLKILYTILASGGSKRMPVDVLTTLPQGEDHPYPKRDDGYQRVVNCARPGEAPRMCPDPHHHDLNWTQDFAGRPPFEEIQGLDGNTMTRDEFADPLFELLDGITDDDEIEV